MVDVAEAVKNQRSMVCNHRQLHHGAKKSVIVVHFGSAGYSRVLIYKNLENDDSSFHHSPHEFPAEGSLVADNQ